ncbi:MAG: tetratricopeptide repeat protein [Planctomycetaceae bacterium]|nr:tetratricopeptide repeat protein [Planctomycetaceae bacterium]
MPESSRWLCLFVILGLSGCQTASQNSFAWLPFGSNTRAYDYATEPTPESVVPTASLDSREDAALSTPAPASRARIDELVASGIQAIQQDRLDDASNAFQSVLDSDPSNATAHHGIAMIADLRQDWSDAEYHYKQALRSRPQDAGLLNDLGYSYLLQNRFHEASSYLTRAVEQNPQHEKAQENLAMLALRQGDRSSAEEQLKKLHPANQVAMQMQRLESQLQVATSPTLSQPVYGDSSPSGIANTSVPQGASFEQVRALAEQKRLEAEAERRRRSAPPASHLASTAVNPWVAGQTSQPGYQNSLSGAVPAALTQQDFDRANTIPTPMVHQAVASNSQMMQPAGWPQSAQAADAVQASNAMQSVNVQTAQAPIVMPATVYGQPSMGGEGFMANSSAAGPVPAFQASLSQSPGAGIVAGNPTTPSAIPNTAAIPNTGESPSGSQNPLIQATGTVVPIHAGSNPLLAGLNAAPGALFPVNQPNPESMQTTVSGMPSETGQTFPAPSSPSSGGGGQFMPNGMIGTPNPVGQNPVAQNFVVQPSVTRNGAMFSQPASTLPAQQWQNEMQQQYATTTAGANSQPVVAPNPLAAYDQQLQQLESQYNQSLQQYDPATSSVQPVQAQY